jgi:hypothetical protein
MYRTQLALLLLIGALAGCSDSNNDDDDPAPPPEPEPPPANTEDFDAALNATEVVGGGADSGSATAQVTVNLDDGSVSGTVTLADLDAESVSLHRGFAGETGAVLIDLEEDSATEWSFPGSAGLSEDELDALQSGGLYFQVTTADAPDGAVRGQIVPDGVELLFVRLSGAQEVPPLDTAATAMAALTLDPDANSLVLHLNTAGLDDAAEAHIHEAVAGVNGDILVGLVQDPDDVTHWFLEEFVFDAAQMDALNAGALYLNVHTPAHPPGEVRGQIQPEGVEIFFTSLSGDDVVPPVSTDASGVAAATLDSESLSLILHVNLLELDDAEAVDVRQAAVMQNGPVVLSLDQDPNDVAHWSLEDTTLTDAQREALRNQGLYVNVATPGSPDGEVRGQLVPDMSMPGSGDSFVVTAVEPDDGATVDALPDAVVATFNRDVLAASAGADQVSVTASGGDGSFEDGNEIEVGVVGVNVSGEQLTAELDTNAAMDDVYQILLDGSSTSPLTDATGAVLDGDADGAPGGDFTATFTVDGGSSAPTLTQLQTDIFTPSCAKSGCHAGSTPAQGMNLSDGQTFANTVGVASTEAPSLNRIEPGDPDNSYLVQKVEGTASVGGRMPLDGPPFLSNGQIQSLRDWIAAGAEDN